MAYTTEAKINDMFRKLDITLTSVITSAKITEWIEEFESIINAKLYPYYEVPIVELDSPESFNIVGRISKLFVAHQVKQVLEVNEATADTMQEVSTNYQKEAKALLEKLCPWFNKTTKRWEEPIIPLPDATRKEFAPKTASLFNSASTTDRRIITKGGSTGLGGDNW